MNSTTFVLSIPALRDQDLASMPQLSSLTAAGSKAKIQHSFPAVTWPSQATVLTGSAPCDHGVVANGFFWREESKLEMWTAWNDVIQRPQVWDILKQKNSDIKTAAWFPMLSKGCGADHVCMPAPIHQPDGSEDLWCYTKPQEFYGELLEQIEHFPLQHFWGPLANINSTEWILQSALLAAKKFSPDFWYVYLPHLDYAAQKDGPHSDAANRSLQELDQAIGNFANQVQKFSQAQWLVVSEYVITEVNHVSYPNQVLRKFGLLEIDETDDGELLNMKNSRAWALADHQFSQVFVKDRNPDLLQQVVEIFEDEEGFQMVLAGDQLEYLDMNHERSGDVILISNPDSWQAYYWWLDDGAAPGFARTVDIHRKPGYDPVELHFDPATKSIPLDASLIKGSHGVPAISAAHLGPLLCSVPDLVQSDSIRDTSILDLMLKLTLGTS